MSYRREFEFRLKPSLSISLSVTSNSSNNLQRCPINAKAFFGIRLQDSILREVREVHEFVIPSIEAQVIFRQQVMFSFFNSLCLWARKMRHLSVSPEHLLKLSSTREAFQFPIALIPEHVTKQPSSLIDRNPENWLRPFARSVVTWTTIEVATEPNESTSIVQNKL